MRIKNWHELQHFKDRTPPWIKLYRNILDQRDINVISDCSFRVLIGLWLLAAEDKALKGNLPKIPDIAFRLRKSEKEITKSIQELSAFIIHDDIKLISERYQLDAPETETYTQETYKKEAEVETNIGDFESFWETYGRIGNKQQAIKSYNKQIKETSYEIIIEGLNKYQEWTRANTWYNPKHASTWLNNKGWEDDYTIHKKTAREQSKYERMLSAAQRGHEEFERGYAGQEAT